MGAISSTYGEGDRASKRLRSRPRGWDYKTWYNDKLSTKAEELLSKFLDQQKRGDLKDRLQQVMNDLFENETLNSALRSIFDATGTPGRESEGDDILLVREQFQHVMNDIFALMPLSSTQLRWC